MTPASLTPVPFDPELAAGLDATLTEQIAQLSFEALPEIRERSAERDLTDEQLRQDGRFEVTSHTTPSVDGAEVPLLVCRPAGLARPAATLYVIHGGGMVAGTNRGPEMTTMLDWAERFDLLVVSVDYRLAPVHQYPLPVQDCHAGLRWTAADPEGFGVDPDRIVVLGGSAGGGLAAATTLLARDQETVRPMAQLLICPMLDDRNDTLSSIQMAGLGIWDRDANQLGWTALLGDRRGGPDVSPYAAPARATDLSGLPPTFIDVGSAETFRDEAVAYASRIWACGGRAELHVWPGGFHGFDAFVPQAAVSQAALAARENWLRRVLAA
ncbi:alpha/beta hydrolase [Crossiella sp. SN42]|uniref:alpha/beta hydrolase n=1 Tax=Crossiella sp. SN42 TaxID=2944808 RepID=UPI00207D4346|nr:alpha/beta hydrolase fold domain-containing protein [Crossiella sp. SN42]MCO1577246.1 alpha/beta hydrolase [Crossiella sp. SN42]